MLNGASDIASHAARHGQMRAVGGLKLIVYQRLFVADSHADEAIGLSRFNGELLRFNDFNDLDVVSREDKMCEVVGIVLNEVFGDGVNVCHKRCPGSEG